MKFKRLAEYFEKIEKTASRLEMTGLLAELFKEVSVEEIDLAVYLSLGMMRPKFEGIEFNLAEKMMLRVVSAAYKTKLKTTTEEYKKTGNFGEVVANLAQPGQDANLTVAQVYKRLLDIAMDEGLGSQDRKVNNMAKLLNDLDSLSSGYAVRIPINNLRLGFSDMTILDALSWMAKGDKSLRPELERAFNVCADIGEIAKVFKESGLPGISGIRAKIGVPIRPAKSERLPSAAKIVEKLEVFGVEGKWDGLRVQIHLDKTKNESAGWRRKTKSLFEEEKYLVRIFSRNLDNTTAMFPEIAKAVAELPVKSVILDGEAVGYDPKTGKLLGFQETVQRKRKHGVALKAEEVPVKVFVYDILFLDGEMVMGKTFRERRKMLEKVMSGVKEGLELAEQEIISDAKRLRELMIKYLKMGLEGVMCKKLTTAYQAGARNFNWVKLKKATEGELVDTIDAVVMGYYAGKGKRTGFGVGAFLVGVTDGEKIGSIAKIGTGLTDEQWQELKARSTKLETRNKPAEYLVDKNLEPDVWLKPELVTEILADEITKSPIHAFGLALRFPRLVNFRDDKNLSEATSKRELEKLFKMQKNTT